MSTLCLNVNNIHVQSIVKRFKLIRKRNKNIRLSNFNLLDLVFNLGVGWRFYGFVLEVFIYKKCIIIIKTCILYTVHSYHIYCHERLKYLHLHRLWIFCKKNMTLHLQSLYVVSLITKCYSIIFHMKHKLSETENEYISG